LIGCTSSPADCNKKEVMDVFKKNRLYFPLPEASSLKMIWEKFIQKYDGKITEDFKLTNLAEAS